MTSIILSLIVAFISLISWILESYFKHRPMVASLIRFISMTIAIGSVASAFLSLYESTASENASLKQTKRILELENSSLQYQLIANELKKETAQVTRKSNLLAQELSREKNRIKSIATSITVLIEGDWISQDAPYVLNTIPMPTQDTVILEAFAAYSKRTPLKFYPTEYYRLIEHRNGLVEFRANISLRGDADILAGDQSEFFKFTHFVLYVPMIRWSVLKPIPLTVTKLNITHRINDNQIIKYSKVLNQTFSPPPPSKTYGDFSSSFLSIPILIEKKDYTFNDRND